jgi:hypothetical protein
MTLNRRRFSVNGNGGSIEQRNRRVNDSLAAQYDQLNRKWQDVEASLKAMLVPHNVWVAFDSEEVEFNNSSAGTDFQCLGLVKVKGEWRICIGEYNDMDAIQRGLEEEPQYWKPILDCGVEERVRLASHVSTLRKKIIEAKERYVTTIDGALDHLDKVLEETGD